MHRQLWIDGAWSTGTATARVPVVDPATEQTVGSLIEATPADVDAAVRAAAAALPQARRLDPRARSTALRRIAARLRIDAGRLAALETLDVGKPRREADLDVADSAAVFDLYADLLDGGLLAPEEVPVPGGEYRMRARRVPTGVVALVTPWNFPLLLASWKLAPALAAGCAVVLKPSELASLTPLELGPLAEEAFGIAGLVNVVTGTGPAVGAPLVAHPHVRKVSFTGSGDTGRRVLSTALADFRRVTLELGGKSPAIVLADADLDAALEWVLGGIFYNQGEVCSATSRLLVDRTVHHRFVEALVSRAGALRLGPGSDPSSDMGPLISAAHRTKVLAMIERSRAEGARIATGGGPPPDLVRGYYVRPTVLLDVPTTSTAWREEFFGPVLAVRPFDTEDEAVRLANASEYGLAGAVFSADAARAERVAESLEVGCAWINCAGPALPQGPWGGFKRSGFGRELGRWGIDAYTEWQQLTTRLQP